MEGRVVACYSVSVTPRLALAVIAVAVVAMGVYLFVEVHAGPAEAQVAAVDPAPQAAPTVTPSTSQEARPSPRIIAPHGMPAKVEKAEPPPTVQSDDDNAPPVEQELLKPNPRLDAIMDRANKAYDHQDFDEAKAIAGKVLAKQPTNVRMLRIMVSSSCIDGDVAVAQKYYPSLPKYDRDQMKMRCDRYGVTLTDP